MPAFGSESLQNRAELHPDLQEILDEAIIIFDFSITEGHRGQAKQHKCFLDGSSKVDWPKSKHNSIPSRAVDLCPYRDGLKWEDREAFYMLAGIIRTIAFQKGIRIRQGADWDMDGDVHDQTFHDLPHIELVEG